MPSEPSRTDLGYIHFFVRVLSTRATADCDVNKAARGMLALTARKRAASHLLLIACLSSRLAMSTSLPAPSLERNVLGQPLVPCSESPKTGFYRTGICSTGPDDHGTHVVCATMTKAFLDFTVSRGNDLVTPRPEYRFPGLKPGDRWCLCAGRWREALRAGVAPPVRLECTHEKALEFVKLDDLQAHAEA
jgi:uncharacterized protein (DUF2237 family)